MLSQKERTANTSLIRGQKIGLSLNGCTIDFIICGYIHKTDGTSILLGQYSSNGNLVYMGNVSSGLSRDSYATITQHEKSSCPFITVPKENEKAIWIKPDMVCSVQWMPRQNGALNQPVFKGFRDDILALNLMFTFSKCLYSLILG